MIENAPTSATGYVCYEQHVEGDEHQNGQVILLQSNSFRRCVDKARDRAQELKQQGVEAKVIESLRGRSNAYGYRITEKPKRAGVLGDQWNLLVLPANALDPVHRNLRSAPPAE